ncbi:hypothetical protein [Bacillus benzoevorans]|uniref:Uncharacterized membrane protein YoaK (UPF0700 family) n=1 Tax=Bacillus benzoevorans TaxID=1456 RepID=A0A7X0LVA2_9BACI|nr:hypothetical protein [Bacillus benzoevorans]MBB6444089.1 uncharacterized membrane protein YoaK (UPF0700 family) [Bacillus benzoevorans]
MDFLVLLLIPALIGYSLYSYLKRKGNRRGLLILTIISLSFVTGMIIGSFIGMDLGGNYYGDFVFNGGRGYEAAGQIGAIIGGLLGAVCGLLLVLLIFRNKGNRKLK